jgi:transcriptional antiterminator Rof (Rho-off)
MEYKPISCSLYDRIESLAVQKKNVEVTYLIKSIDCILSGKIENIFSKEKAEYLEIENIEIRLDHIKTIKEI